MLEITYYAEGQKFNGNKVTLADVTGDRSFDKFTIDEKRWYHCNTTREEEALQLGVARRDYSEVNWEHAHRVESRRV